MGDVAYPDVDTRTTVEVARRLYYQKPRWAHYGSEIMPARGRSLAEDFRIHFGRHSAFTAGVMLSPFDCARREGALAARRGNHANQLGDGVSEDALFREHRPHSHGVARIAGGAAQSYAMRAEFERESARLHAAFIGVQGA